MLFVVFQANMIALTPDVSDTGTTADETADKVRLSYTDLYVFTSLR